MDTVNLEISKGIIQPIIEAKIKAIMVEAMGDQDALIGRVVQEVLSRKVDANGKVSNYASENKYPYVEGQLRISLNAAVQSAVAEYIAEREIEIKQELLKALDTKKTKNALVAAMVDGFVKQAQSPKMSIVFELPEIAKDDEPFF